MASDTTAPRKPGGSEDRPPGWWCYPIMWALVAWVAPMLTDRLDWWWLIGISAVVALLGSAVVRTLWPSRIYGGLCAHAVLFAIVVGGALGGWLLLARFAGGPLRVWQHWLIGSAVLGGWWLLLALRAPAAVVDFDPVAAEQVGEPEIGGVYREILAEAGVLPACRITDVTSSPSGGVVSVHLRAVPRAKGAVMTYDGLRAKLATIATHADLRLEGDIDESDVTPERITGSRWILHFTVKRVLAAEFPYKIRTEPRPADDPSKIGQYETDSPIDLQFYHRERGATCADVVAGMGGGKTVLLHNLIAEDNACDAWEVWLFSSQKLTHLAWPWIRPWLTGKVDRPPVDAIFGQAQTRILLGLSWACQLAERWNASTSGVRQVEPGKGGLTVVIDESSDCLKNKRQITFKLGAEMVAMNASEMVAKLAEIGRTSPVKVYRASQYGLFNSAGPAGHESRRNFLAAIVGRVTRTSDARNVAPALPPGSDPVRLRDNMIYVQPNLEEPTVLRAKAYALVDERVEPVAVAYTAWRNGLDPAFTRQLRGYDERWRAEHHPDLVQFAASEGLQWPGTTAPAAPASSAPDGAVPPEEADRTIVTAPPTKEATVTPQRPSNDLPLPDGWEADNYDVWAAFEGQAQPAGGGMAGGSAGDAEEATRIPTATGDGSVLSNPDTSGIKRALRRWEADRERVRKLARLPEPLGKILAQMEHPRAQRIVATGWVPTEVLAMSLGRCDRDADDDTRRRAVAQLGKEINQITGLQSQEIPRPVGLGRKAGWKVSDLREAGERLMRDV